MRRPDPMPDVDEHMEAARAVLPMTYEATMVKVQSLDKAHKS